MRIDKKFKKHRGGIDTIIITLILIAIVLVSIPMLKSITNSNAKNSKNISDDIINITE